MTIFLMGYMGSGKSTLGKMLAEKINYNFLDFDSYIEGEEKMTVAEIFKNKGEIYFRKIESKHLTTVLSGFDDTIISLGGGTPCYGTNMELIKNAQGVSVYINVPVEELIGRLWEARLHRPLLAHQDTKEKLEEYIRKHLFERGFYYNQADFKLFAAGKSEAELVDELEAKLF